jgi:2-deoxy-D-gluconate 3-dehydrogenase
MNFSALFDLRGQTAIVTGVRRGIGKAMALALAEAGADIIGVSQNLDPDGGDIGDAVRAVGRTFEAIRADLSRREATLELGTELGKRGAEILVLNHGMAAREPAVEHPTNLWDTVLEVNLTSHWILAQAVGRGMVERGRGKIIFTASLFSYHGGNKGASYTASKHGIAGMTKALSNEWAPAGVQVNAIAPGFIDTDINVSLVNDKVRAPKFLERIPAGRWGRPDDMAGPVVFLASRASDYVSGTLIAVDGGWLAQ